MRGVTRKSADSAGGVLIEGSGNVFANTLPVVRIGDSVMGHGPGEHGGPVMATGSGNVFTNNIPTCRRNDLATCGHNSSGSGNVFVN